MFRVVWRALAAYHQLYELCAEGNPPISVTKLIQLAKARKRVFRILRGGVRATGVSPNNLALGAFGRALDLAPRPLIWVDGAPRRSRVAVCDSG